jgi:Winged helix DNA-binding domain
MSNPGTMTRGEVLRRRLRVQHLTGSGAATAADVVRRLTCVQSQEWAHGFWSLGMRTQPRLDYAGVQAEFDAGDILRTHILRPTWHYVAPEDLGWVLAATSARVHQRNATMYAKTDLDRTVRDRTDEVLLEALRGTALTRAELAARLADSGLAADGMRLAYVLMSAELDGLIVSGPLRGVLHTYARLDERLAGRPRDRRANRPDEPVAELLRRFLAGHGPATLADFARWASLTVSDAEAALPVVRDRLDSAEVDGLEVWWAADTPDPHPVPGPETGRAFLLPLYDELTLSYPKLGFPAVPGHPHQPGADLFRGTVIIGERNVGLWKRTVRGRRVEIEVDLATGCSAADRRAAREAAAELASFLGRELVE